MRKLQITDFIRDWILPPRIYQHIAHSKKTLLNKITNPEDTSILLKNRKLKNKFFNKRCFVIGNGPSLARQDLTCLKDEITIVCNQFHKNDVIKQWQPTIFCSGDPVSSYLAGDPISSCLLNIDDSLLYLKEIFRFTNALDYIFPVCTYKFIQNYADDLQLEHIDQSNLLGVNFGWDLDTLPSTNINIDLTKDVPSISHTPMLSIMTAIYMGCNPIVLIGCDHDNFYKYIKGDYKITHFYEELNPGSLKNYSYLIMTDAIRKTYNSYQNLNFIACNKGIKIFDATDQGHLDVFEKCDFLSFFDN
ncbi:hypothetical protein TUMEXPCC7403_18655 [Tumidithrix helvetica PCC 7403]|uniref:hypothetical protein n=1 Tax=Tumidithrix helvetica TaxID=3457545 RepID=UPI003C9848EB